MPVHRNSLFLTRNLEDVAYLRRLSNGLQFYQEAVRRGLTQDLIQKGLVENMPLWETSTISNCWDMMDEEPLICEIITTFILIPIDDDKHIAMGGAMLKHFVDPLIENWPGKGVALSDELTHRDLKAEWNDFVGHPSDWSHRRTPEHIVQRSQAAGSNRERRGVPDAVHGPNLQSAAALPNVNHGGSRSLSSSSARNRRRRTSQVKKKTTNRQKSRLNQVSTPEETSQHHQQSRQPDRRTKSNGSAIPVSSAETYDTALEGDPDETEDDSDNHSLEAPDGDYERGEMDLDFDEVQPFVNTSGAKKRRIRKSKSTNMANTPNTDMLSDAEKMVAEKKAERSAKLSSSMKARWADGRMKLVMEKITQTNRAKRAAKSATPSMEPILVPTEETLELEVPTPTPPPQLRMLQQNRQALKSKEAVIAMGEATAIATLNKGIARSFSNVDFALDAPNKGNDPFAGAGDAVHDANKHKNEGAPRGPRGSRAANAKTPSHPRLRKKGDDPIDDGNIDFEPALLGVCDPSKLRISIDHERTLSDGQIVSGLPGEYSTGTRIHFNYSGKVDWDKESSINKLNLWRSSISYRNFKSGWRNGPARWLQSEKDWTLAYMQANGCTKWNRLTNAYNKHFGNVLQLKGEPFINVCGDNPTLAMDRKAPLRTREAIELVAKRWEEYQTLFAGNVSQTGPVEQTIPSIKPRIILNITKRRANGDSSSMGAEPRFREAELLPMREPSMTSNLAPPMASTIDAVRLEPWIAVTLASSLANAIDTMGAESPKTGTLAFTMANAINAIAAGPLMTSCLTPEIGNTVDAKISDDDELIPVTKKNVFRKTSRVSFGNSRSMEMRPQTRATSQMHRDSSSMSANAQGKQIVPEPALENYDDGPEYSEEFVRGVLEARKKPRTEGQTEDNKGPGLSSEHKPELS